MVKGELLDTQRVKFRRLTVPPTFADKFVGCKLHSLLRPYYISPVQSATKAVDAQRLSHNVSNKFS